MESSVLSSRYEILKSIDEDAIGHYARAFLARRCADGKTLAFKILRRKHLFIEKKDVKGKTVGAFLTETHALKLFHEHPTVVDFYDCGFIKSSTDIPTKEDSLISLGLDDDAFGKLFHQRITDGWLPYVVVEHIPDDYSTYLEIEPDNHRVHKRFPTARVLTIISQFVDLLVYVQSRGYVYADHKLAHTYWDWRSGKLRVIDWNGGHFLENLKYPAQIKEKLAEDCKELIGNVMYTLLTGREPVPTVGVLPDGGRTPDRLILPEHIGGSSLLQPLLDDALGKRIADATELRKRLDVIMLQYGLSVANQQPEEINTASSQRVQALFDSYGRISLTVSQLGMEVNEILAQEDGRLPKHFQEELASLYEALRRLENATIIITGK